MLILSSPSSHLAWANLPRKEGGLGPDLKLALLSDKNHKVAKDYGVLLEDEGVALRGLFLIDPKGTLRQITINDLPVGRSVEETIRLVKAFQFVEEHGEGEFLSDVRHCINPFCADPHILLLLLLAVCPASWDPDTNASTIKADPKASVCPFRLHFLARSSPDDLLGPAHSSIQLEYFSAQK